MFFLCCAVNFFQTDNLIFFFLYLFSVRGRQAVTRGFGDDGGETECEYSNNFLTLKNKHEVNNCLIPHFPLHWQEKNTELYRASLEELRRLIRSSTTSMTSVPKPLKFLRPHYGKLKEIYDGMAPGENKVRIKIVSCFFLFCLFGWGFFLGLTHFGNYVDTKSHSVSFSV